MNQLLTVQEAAARLQMHPGTVRRQLQTGALRGVKHGREWRIPEGALAEEVSPLAKAIAMILERDAREGPVPIRQDGSVLTDLREIREANTP